jgi:hypothetical protein
MNAPDNRLEQRARRLYREAAHRLDPATAGRLRAARRTALERAQAPRGARPARLLLPAGAFAAVALAVLTVWQPPQRHAAATHPAQAIEADFDLPPDADSADPNLYQNLDFYGWLAANDSPDASDR